jgi:hypothetical protein
VQHGRRVVARVASPEERVIDHRGPKGVALVQISEPDPLVDEVEERPIAS